VSHLDIDDVSSLVDFHVGGEVGHTLLTEVTREEVTRARSVSE